MRVLTAGLRRGEGNGWRRICAVLSVIVAWAALTAMARAEPRERRYNFNIREETLGAALDAIVDETGYIVLYPYELAGRRDVNPVIGRYTIGEAIEELFRETKFSGGLTESGAIVISLSGEATEDREDQMAGGTLKKSLLASVAALVFGAAAHAQDAETVDDQESNERSDEGEERDVIVVTGTNIRGVQNTGSPLISIDRDSIVESGFSTTSQLIDSLPQNIASGATERGLGISSDQSAVSNNVQGTAVNLRGLGGGTTLVLLDGRRLTPSGRGSFIDVSMIPLSMIERVEVVADGASAIYGADAIAGVVNFVLRDDYDGAETLVRYVPDFGKDVTEIALNQIVGRSWGSGNAFAGIEYFNRDKLSTTDRSFSAGAVAPNDILPEQERLSIIGSLNQELGDTVEAFARVVYSARDAEFRETNVVFSRLNKSENNQVEALLGARFDITAEWQGEITGQYGQTKSSGEAVDLMTDAVSTTPFGDYKIKIINAKVDGALVDLPAGALRAAFGGGYREESLDRSAGGPDLEREIASLFAEAIAPILNNLEFRAAGRYEDYSDFGDTGNVQLGARWAPAEPLTLRGSWGTSFRAPLLSDFVTTNNNAILFSAADPFAPDGQTLTLFLNGGNPDLTPEEAVTWTVGADISIGSSVSLAVTYFNIDFDNRLGKVPSTALASVTESAVTFAPAVRLEPTPTELQALLDQSPVFLDFFGMPFTLADIEAVFDNRTSNLASTMASGVDVLFNYNRDIGDGRLTLSTNVTYLNKFEQKAADNAPAVDILNTAFNPVGLKLRSSLGFAQGAVAGTLFANYVDGYTNDTSIPETDVDSWITFDATLRVDLSALAPSAIWADGLTLSIAAQNVFDEDPPFVQTPPLRTAANFDPVNASPLGRYVAFQISKSW